MNWDVVMALSYAGIAWFMQLCLLWSVNFVVGKKADYLLFMNIQGEQREDADVLRTVQAFKKEFWTYMGIFFVTALGHFLLIMLPVGIDSLQVLYLTLWCTALIVADYKVTKKYANRMYELKLSKGWGNQPKASALEVDTVVSRMKKTMPVSELWLGFSLWVCVGGFLWWGQCATDYKWLLLSLVLNIAIFVFFCYLFHRMAHGKLKVYSEDSEINYALNRASKRAWTGCIAWVSFLICGYNFFATVWMHSYMRKVSEGRGNEADGAFWTLFISGSLVSMALVIFCFIKAANRVKQAKKELAAAANLSFAEDEDAYWKDGYYYNPYDTNSFVESRTLGITTNMATKWGPITKWMLIGAFVMCVGLSVSFLPFDFGTVKATVETDRIEVKGCLYYKETLYFEDVAEVVLLEELPESARVWGTGTDRVALGSYHLKEYGNVKLIMLKEVPLYLMVKKTDGKWFGFSVEEEKEMQEYYALLKNYGEEK